MFETLAAASQTSEVLQAEPFVPWARLQVNSIADLVLLVCSLIAIIIAITAAIKAKGAIAGILVGICTAALFIWGVNSLGPNDKPKELIDDQINYRGAAGVAHHVDS